MEILIKELCRTFFQQLPNGLCLIFAIGVLVSLALILPKRKHHNPLYAAFWLAILVMVLWRVVIGLVAVRYVAVLIIPAVMLTAFVGFRAESWWRWLCRKYGLKPRCMGKVMSRLLVYGCSAGALAIAIWNCSSGQKLYQATYEIIREYRRKMPAVKVLVQADEVKRIRYYTGASLLPLTENRKEEVKKFFPHADGGTPLLVVVRDRPKYSRISFAQEELLPGAKWELLRRVSRSSRHVQRSKELNVYLYTPPAQKGRRQQK